MHKFKYLDVKHIFIKGRRFYISFLITTDKMCNLIWFNCYIRGQMPVIGFHLTSEVGLEKQNVKTRMSAANFYLPIPIMKVTLIKLFKLLF